MSHVLYLYAKAPADLLMDHCIKGILSNETAVHIKFVDESFVLCRIMPRI